MSGAGNRVSPPSRRDVVERAQGLGFELAAGEAESLAFYLAELVRWNARMNLVGRRTWTQAFDDLVADSLHLARFLASLDLPEAPACLDLGAGAGLPGIPLRILWQKGEYVLIEPRQKRAAFLHHVLSRLRLPGVAAKRCRAEDLEPGGADLVVSRAFREWREYLGIASGLLAPGGRAVVMASGEMGGEAVAGLSPEKEDSYPVPGGRRYFWSFCAPPPSMASS